MSGLRGVPMSPRKHVSLFSQHFWTFLPKVHIQTIGILVSEKAELQTALAHTQQAARQKAGKDQGTLQPCADALAALREGTWGSI